MALWPFRVAAVLMAVGAVGIAFAGVIVAGACWLAPVQLKEQRAVDRYDHIRSLPTEGMEEAVAADYAGLYCDLHDNYRYLYDYGYALFRCGRYADAIPVLERGAGRSSDPMFWVIIGRCQEGLGRYPDAIRSLEYAWRMVPGRLYPLVLLKEMHERLGDLPGAEEYKERAGNVPLNPRNRNMMELHERIGK
jgi:tetratricopeptide (TPR) repeat protein